MYAKFFVNRETANNFMRLFVNRRAYAIQAERPLPNGSVPYYPARDWKTKEPKPLDEGVVRMHLNGDITISLYAINPETQRSKWVAIDADFDGSLESLFQLQWELKQDGVDAALEQSRRGGHLWIFGAEPLLASECRIYVYNLALRLGIPVKGGGLKEGIEVFPRQDRLEDGELGNAIRAPIGVHRKTNRRYWFYEAEPTPEAQIAYLDGYRGRSAGASTERLRQRLGCRRDHGGRSREGSIQPDLSGRHDKGRVARRTCLLLQRGGDSPRTETSCPTSAGGVPGTPHERERRADDSVAIPARGGVGHAGELPGAASRSDMGRPHSWDRRGKEEDRGDRRDRVRTGLDFGDNRRDAGIDRTGVALGRSELSRECGPDSLAEALTFGGTGSDASICMNPIVSVQSIAFLKWS
jgi:hypothetical protein